jgi:hypothetical protein
MPESRTGVVANTLAVLGGVLVVALHLYAGISDSGRPVLRPVGEATIFVLFGWILSIILCAPALILTRGRSRTAIGALAVTLTSAALLFSV